METRIGTNQLMALFPPAVRLRLSGQIEEVHLQRKEVLFRAHEPLRVVYFPITALVSLVARLESGNALEVGLIGRDGLAGTAIFPGVDEMTYDGVVQIPWPAPRLSADVLRRELESSEPLHRVLGKFAQVLLVRCMQMSACNMFHKAEQRCLRWLLTVSDLLDANDIPLTHELLATMLGVHRPTVTLVLQALQ